MAKTSKAKGVRAVGLMGGALVRRHEALSLLEMNASLLPMLTDDGLIQLTEKNTGRNKGSKLDHKAHVLATLRRMRQEAR